MALKLTVSVKEIGYAGESIGQEFDFTFDVQEQRTTIHQRIVFSKEGEPQKSLQEAIFTQQDVVTESTINLPIKVAIIEQDKDVAHHDTGEGETTFPVRIVESQTQTHAITVKVLAEQGSDAGKEAVMTLVFEATIFDEDVPKCLTQIEGGIAEYTSVELNDALVTMFGELSSSAHPRLGEEAEAIASTIFHRKSLFENAQVAYQQAKEEEAVAQQEYKAAIAAYEELTYHPTKYRKEFGKEEYDRRVSLARQAYRESRQQLSLAQKTRIDAVSQKKETEFFVSKSKRNATITLTDIVALNNQYKGTKTGKGYVKAYSQWSYVDQKRNCERWKAAKAAIEKLARNPNLWHDYLYFITNENGALPLREGRMRIGGNDFWK